MTPNAKRARLVMNLMQLTGKSITNATAAAGRIAEALFPDEAPAVYDQTLAGKYVLREAHEATLDELERVRALLIAGQAPIVVPPEGAVPRAIFENMRGELERVRALLIEEKDVAEALRVKINDLQNEVASLKELRDAHNTQILELTRERDAARASAGDWEVSHARLQKSSAPQIKDLTEALQYWRKLANDREARMVSAIGALKEST